MLSACASLYDEDQEHCSPAYDEGATELILKGERKTEFAVRGLGRSGSAADYCKLSYVRLARQIRPANANTQLCHITGCKALCKARVNRYFNTDFVACMLA